MLRLRRIKLDKSKAKTPTTEVKSELFEKVKQEELNKLEKQGEKFHGRFRTGSVMIKLDAQIKSSSKSMTQTEADAPILMPKELSDVLRSPLLRHAFRTYLKKKYAAESLIFFEAIELFRTIKNDEMRIQVAEGIMKQFIEPEAEFSVNISSADRTELLARERTHFWPTSSFDEVQREMFLLLNQNFFKNFCRMYWPGGVLVAIPGTPFSDDTNLDDRAFGSNAPNDELGSGSTVAVVENELVEEHEE